MHSLSTDVPTGSRRPTGVDHGPAPGIALTHPQRHHMQLVINERLADVVDLRMQLKHAFWNVKSARFISLHQLFEKMDADVAGYLELIAARIVQLGGIADGTVRTSAARSRLPEYPPNLSDALDHVDAVTRALSGFGHELRESIHESRIVADGDTTELLSRVSRGVDKWLWYVHAHYPTR